MTQEQIIAAVEKYRNLFNWLHVKSVEHDHQRQALVREHILQHCCSMLDRVEEFVSAGRLEKAFRWLGFIQGCLWSNGVYTIEQLREDNKREEND